jgi:hypothetical protein
MAKNHRSSLKPFESFAKWNPDSFSWKTSQPSPQGDSTEFSEKWPTSGLMRRGQCYLLPIVELTTSEDESGSCAKEKWVTPNSRDWKDTAGQKTTSINKDGTVRNRLDQLPRQVFARDESKTGGQLNPLWVGWIMGWPIGWEGLKPLGTVRFRLWQQQHGQYLSKHFRTPLPKNSWLPVIFSADCDEDGNCPCGVDYAEDCLMPGPTQDEFEYVEIDGVMLGRKIKS